ncbi:hypothetical protein NEAUS03_0031 [Nematocida ausubeli]|nr:hypothetical protein NEAUS03_0031 [Nematocida ausubeli]
MNKNLETKENRKRRIKAEIRKDRPNIICCIKNEKIATSVDAYGVPIRERTLLSGVELEKKIRPKTPVYVLKRHLTISKITLPVLDVLDTRNTFLWVEFFRSQIVAQRWSEKEAKVFFKYSIAGDILETVVGNPMEQTLRDSVRKIYDVVYTPARVARLKKRIETIQSGEFVSLEEYNAELGLLLRSYSVWVMMSPSEMEEMHQMYFWQGLSDYIKRHLNEKIDQTTPIDEIIRLVVLYKQKLARQYNLTNKFTGVIFAGDSPVISFSADEGVQTMSMRESPREVELIDCSRNARTSSRPPMPSISERPVLKLPMLRKIPEGLIIKNDLPGTLNRIVEKYSHKKRERIFRKPDPEEVFIVYCGCIRKWTAGILMQNNKVVSVTKTLLVGEQLKYTETEKCILAINKCRRIFKKITGDAIIIFMSDKYESFIYTTENDLSFVNGVQIPE